MLKKLVNEVKFSLTLTTTGPVLIRSGHATLTGPDMTPVLTYRNGERQVYLPGSSLKGVFRNHVEKVSRTLNEAAVCNPFSSSACGTKLQARKKQNEKSVTNEVAYHDSCVVCRLFGSTFFIGRVSISDAYLVDESRPLPTELRDGVGIDRLTGGAAHGAKFDLEAVSSGVQFRTDVYLRNFECWQLGMLLLVVQDLHDGLIRVGSGTSRGLGGMVGQVSELTINHLGNLSQKPAPEIWGLGKFLGENSPYGTTAQDVLHLENAPQPTRQGIRLVTVFNQETLPTLQAAAINAYMSRLQN
ncbi:MAG: CRISPR-associated RAMP protein [Anaerolineae bacterium]|nr:CRISPR-associated RAMP protein [Anaerolineae bacterium]